MQATLPDLKGVLSKKHSLTLQIIEGSAPENIIEFASNGLLPIPRFEIVEILIFLIINDSKYKENAKKTLAQIKVDDLTEIMKRSDLMPEVYTYFSEIPKQNKKILQTLLYNRSVPNNVFEIIAENGTEDIIDIIVTNQVRLLNCPPIIDKLLRNPQLSSDQKRRIVEFREEFFEKVSVGNPLFKGLQREKEVAVEEERPEPQDLQAIMEAAIRQAEKEMQETPHIEDFKSEMKKERETEAEKAEEEVAEEDMVKPPEEKFTDEERKSKKVVSAYNKIMRMNIPEKIQLAILGTREERTILIRDSNKQVSQAVLKSPKLTASDVQVISTFRQVDSDVLQGIANIKKWIKDYGIVLNLVRNPKTPQGVALHLLNRVTMTDLKILKLNKNVPEVVRRTAQIMIIERSSSSKG